LATNLRMRHLPQLAAKYHSAELGFLRAAAGGGCIMEGNPSGFARRRECAALGRFMHLGKGDGINPQKSLRLERKRPMNDTLKTIHSLRTIHGDFSEKEIREDDLNQILEACIRTANASARQSYSIIVLEDRKKMQELFSYQGSRALIFCVDYTRIMAAAKYLGHRFDNDDVIGFLVGTMDTMLAAQTAVLAAKSLGIDSLVTNGLHRNNLDKVYQTLHLPETSCFPLITVVLGYPQQEPTYQKGRLSLEFVTHRGQYQHLTEEQLARVVAEYDDPQRHLGLMDDWEQQGFKHYLDWFYQKWSGEPSTEKIATGKVREFQERLMKSGFWWPMA
jgi:nitroreductase